MAAGPPTPPSSGLPPPPRPPKIILAKPPAPSSGGRDDVDPAAAAAAVLRSRGNTAQQGSLKSIVSDSWDFQLDPALPFLTENTDFIVVGIIGPPGVGKSTIMNEIYGFDGSSPGMLPPFATESEETRAMSRHSTVGIELRISAERFILLDTQPVFSPSVLVDMMRPDGSSTIPVLNGEHLSAELAHELMSIQLGVFLASTCNVLLVISEGVDDLSMWELMLTVDLLKHGIPDPSALPSSHAQGPNVGLDWEKNVDMPSGCDEFLADLVFVQAKLRDQELSPSGIILLRKALLQYFESSSFNLNNHGSTSKAQVDSSGASSTKMKESEFTGPDLFLLPTRMQDDSQKFQFQSYSCVLGKLRNQVLSMNPRPFAKPMSERDWLRSSAKIWELVKKSPIIADYCRTLQSSGFFRK